MLLGLLAILLGAIAPPAVAADHQEPAAASLAPVAQAAARCTPRSRHYRTMPSSHPSPYCVSLHRPEGAARAHVLLTPRRMPRPPHGQNAAMIVSPQGRLLWYLPRRERVYDLKMVTYRGRPHLAVHVRTGEADGVFELRDARYRVVKRIAFGAPYRTDLHELRLTRQGTAYLGAYRRLRMRGVGVVTEYVVREIDLDTGRVLFEWHSLDDVPLARTFRPQPRRGTWDYFHGNSIEPPVPGDPTVIVSARNTAAVYGIDRASGELRWVLGGKSDDFGIARGGTRFCAQHAARRLPNGDVTLFDNGGRGNTEAGCPRHASRVMRFRLDHERRSARLVRTLSSRRSSGAGESLLPVGFGNAQMLPSGNMLVSWGTSGFVSEVSPSGAPRFALDLPNASYRAVAAPWTGRPGGRPALAARRRAGGVDAWASWNGATEITRWCPLAGRDRRRLRAAGRCVRFADLETRLRIPRRARFVGARALDARGRELGRSGARRVR